MKSLWLFLFLIHAILHSHTPFVLFTEPKTATHLLIPVLESLTGKHVFWAPQLQNHAEFSFDQHLDLNHPNLFCFSLDRAPWTRDVMDYVWNKNHRLGTFLHLHAPYSPTMEAYLLEKNCLNIFIKRDPRDRIVSLLNHYRYIHLNDPSLQSIASHDEKLLIMIRKYLRRSTLHFMGWLTSPASIVLDFAKLMGSHGGAATDADAIEELRKIASALNLPTSNKDLESLYKNSFGHGWNFFKGKVNTWKEYFKEEHKQAAKEEIGDLLIELGYEVDLHW